MYGKIFQNMIYLKYRRDYDTEDRLLILIIAEKPSLGRNIASALGVTRRGEGCMLGDQYIVTWAFGHLFSLADIEAYLPKEARSQFWTMDNLPCFPEKFQFHLRPATTKSGKRSKTGAPDAGVKKQFQIISELCKRADVDTIVNAGDADREGEIIVRLILEQAVPNTEKRMCRLWLPDQTAETIRAAAAQLTPSSDYDALANEGLARTYVDWLYGVNLTRYATLRTNRLLRVGRVIVPIVKAIYDRDMEIRNFVPKPYLSVSSSEKTHGVKVELTSKQRFDADEKGRAAAEALCARYNAANAVVAGVSKKKETLQPGKLYSLTKLQNALGKKYKMPMEKSLAILQGLYEKGYVTYPRTNSEYLATAEKDKMKKILSGVEKLGYPVTFKDKKTIFDDAKIESHSALTPTFKIPNKEQLSPEEMQVYSMIFRRFVAVFCAKDCIAEKTEVKIELREGDSVLEKFTLRGTVIVEEGWMKFDDAPQKYKVLPPLTEGELVNKLFKLLEKETEPPRHYTIETLNQYLKNPFKEDKAKKASVPDGEDVGENADDTEDYRAIFEGLELGTEATRTGIIENARRSNYIKLTKDVYTILPDGEFLIESLGKLEISMDKYKTSTLGRSLKRVFRGEDTVDDCVALARAEIAEVFAKKDRVSVTRLPHAVKQKRTKKADGKEGASEGGNEPLLVVGSCPLCKEKIVRGKFAYGCMGFKNGCAFRISRTLCGRDLSPEEVSILLSGQTTPLLDGFISKAQKPFSAHLSLDMESKDGKINFTFANRNSGGGASYADESAPLPEVPPENK